MDERSIAGAVCDEMDRRRVEREQREAKEMEESLRGRFEALADLWKTEDEARNALRGED